MPDQLRDAGRAGVEFRRGKSPDALRDLPDGCARAILTDPPYGTQTTNSVYGRRSSTKANRIANDTTLAELVATAPEMHRLLDRFGVALVFAAPTQRSAVEDILEGVGFRIDGFAPWDKGRPGISVRTRYCYEECVIASHYGTDDPFERRGPLVVPLRVPPVLSTEHPNEKPVALLRRYLQWAMPDNGPAESRLVIDPFAGIASCGVAAIAERCQYIGVECDPQWWPIAERRIAEARMLPHPDLDQGELLGGAA